MTPIFLSEAIIQTFVFYRDGSLYKGLFSNGQFFKLVRCFTTAMREQAFKLAWELGNRQQAVVITASTQSYRVWVDVSEDIDCDCVHLFADTHSAHASNSLPNDLLTDNCSDREMDYAAEPVKLRL